MKSANVSVQSVSGHCVEAVPVNELLMPLHELCVCVCLYGSAPPPIFIIIIEDCTVLMIMMMIMMMMMMLLVMTMNMLMVGHTQLSIKALCSVQRWSSLAQEIPRVRICIKCVKHSTPKRTVLLYNTLEPQRTFYTGPFGYNPLKIPLNHFHKYYIHTIHIFKRTRRPQKVCAFMC